MAIKFSDKEKLLHEKMEFINMQQTAGYVNLEKWIMKEIDRLNKLLYRCPIDLVEGYRSEARGMQNILDKVDKLIDLKI